MQLAGRQKTSMQVGGSKAAGRSTGATDGTFMGTSLGQALHGRYTWGAGLTQGAWLLPLGLCTPDQTGICLPVRWASTKAHKLDDGPFA